MGRAYKNFWSLNVDEAVAVGILRSKLNKNIAVFMPTSAQMRDVDLAVFNLSSKRVATIQVKGSRAYEPGKSEMKRYRYGSAGWFFFSARKVTECKADYFLFLIYVLKQDIKSGRRNIQPHIILIKTKELIKRCRRHKQMMKGGRWNFFIWVDPIRKKAFDYRTVDRSPIIYDDCLDERGIEKLIVGLR